MGSALFETSTAARAVFEATDRALGFELSTLCFEGPEAELGLTANTQPAILTTSCAVVAALREAYPTLEAPTCAAGHSLGEYSALVASGALTATNAARLVRLRGAAMQRAVPEGLGGMLAVIGAPEAAVEELCAQAREGDVLAPANFNSPGQVVVAGHQTAIERAQKLAKEKKVRVIPLKVSAPFHCSLMKPASLELQSALGDVPVSALAFPVIANVDATAYDSVQQVVPKLVAQVDGAVRWEQTQLELARLGITHALELGPGSVLAGLMKKTAPSIAVLSVDGPDALAKVPQFLGL